MTPCESQQDKNYSLWENLFSYQAKLFLFWENVVKENVFFVSLILPLFLPRYIALKLKQNIVENKFLIHPGNLPLKEIVLNNFKLKRARTTRPNQWAKLFKSFLFQNPKHNRTNLCIWRFSKTANGNSVKLLELFKTLF